MNHAHVRRVLFAAGTLVVGVLAAFFLVFNTLFSDGPASVLHPEYLVAYGLLLVVYGAAAFVAARWGGWGWWTVAWLATPGVLVVALYQDPSWTLRLLVLASLGLGSVAGVLPARVRHRL